MWRVSKPALLRIVTDVVRIEWLLYSRESWPSLDIFFIISPDRCSPWQPCCRTRQQSPLWLFFFGGGGGAGALKQELVIRGWMLLILLKRRRLHGDFYSFIKLSSTFVTNFAPVTSVARTKSYFLKWLRFCRPRRRKQSIISQKTLFRKGWGWLVSKTALSYTFVVSASSIGDLCGTLPRPSFFICTHLAAKTLLALENSGSFIMSKLWTALRISEFLGFPKSEKNHLFSSVHIKWFQD